VTNDAPLVGISTYRVPASWAIWQGVTADLLPAAYARAVERAGGVPVLLPAYADEHAARVAVGRLDALILSGGQDVDPHLYGQVPDAAVVGWDDDRDRSESWLLAAADDGDLPVLGICRGMQLMAVAAGGSLVQHLPDLVGSDRHGGHGGYTPIPVRVEPGHRISQLIPAEIAAPCHHHQSVDRHPGYLATAFSDDGVVHAMEAAGGRFAVAVQWHPETADDPGLFAGLVAAARGR
jgi:putative glutamine amidotransferase